MTPRTRRASPAGPSLTREAALARLFAELFTADELRRWLGGDPARQGVLKNLPGPTATPAELFDATVGVMTRAGLVDGELFDRLVADFPHRAAEIRETAAAWNVIDDKATPTTEHARKARSARSTRGGVNIGENAQVMVGGHLVGGDLIVEAPISSSPAARPDNGRKT